MDRGQHSANYIERLLGCGCGVSVASITRRLLARSLSSDGDQMLPATGQKGASLQRPGYAGNHIGFYLFPVACLY